MCSKLTTFFATRIYSQTTTSSPLPPPNYSSIDLDFILSVLKTEAACYSETMVSVTNQIASEIKRLRSNRRAAAQIFVQNAPKTRAPWRFFCWFTEFRSCFIKQRTRCFSDFCHMASVIMLIWIRNTKQYGPNSGWCDVVGSLCVFAASPLLLRQTSHI